MIDSMSYSSFPALEPSSSFAFYPYNLSSNSKTHAILRAGSAQHSDSLTPDDDQNDASWAPGAGPGPSTEEIQRERQARQRAEKRALRGRRPPGVGLAREAEDLSDEEAAVEDEKQNINLFGHRFLLPFGRRLTQMEMDAAPSPSPSEPDQERRQEDADARSPLAGQQQIQEAPDNVDVGDEEAVDLDASVEDMDASMDADEEDDEEV